MKSKIALSDASSPFKFHYDIVLKNPCICKQLHLKIRLRLLKLYFCSDFFLFKEKKYSIYGAERRLNFPLTEALPSMERNFLAPPLLLMPTGLPKMLLLGALGILRNSMKCKSSTCSMKGGISKKFMSLSWKIQSASNPLGDPKIRTIE